MAKKEETGLSLTSSIRVTTYVRDSEDQDRVNQLVEFLRGGGKTPPIWITDDFQIIDGRTRLAAHELAHKKIEWVKKGELSREEIIFMGLQENVGGSKPPTEADIKHNIRKLLEEKTSRPVIIDRMQAIFCWQRKAIVEIVDHEELSVHKENTLKAKKAVISGGKTFEEACKEFGVKAKSLERELLGKHGQNESSKPTGKVGKTKQALKQVFQNISNYRIPHACETVTKLYIDGLIKKKDLDQFADYLQEQNDRLAKNCANQIARLRQK